LYKSTRKSTRKVAFLSAFSRVFKKVSRGETVGKRWGKIKRSNTNLSEHIRTLKKARRWDNYWFYPVNTYLLALA